MHMPYVIAMRQITITMYCVQQRVTIYNVLFLYTECSFFKTKPSVGELSDPMEIKTSQLKLVNIVFNIPDKRMHAWTINKTRMWANAQRDGRPAEYGTPSVQRREVWLTPTTRVPCSNAAKTRNPLKFAGVPQTRQYISAASGPKFTILWRQVGETQLFNKCFLIVDTALVAEM